VCWSLIRIKTVWHISRSVPVCGHIFRLPGKRHNIHTLPRTSTWPALHTHRHLRRLLDQWYTHSCAYPHWHAEHIWKLLLLFTRNFQHLCQYKECLCALRMVIGIPEGRKQSTYSFSWNFYMNAIAEQGPHLQRNLQCATKFTVSVILPHVYT